MIKKIILFSFLDSLLVLEIYSQSLPTISNEIETRKIYSEGDVNYSYKIEFNACNCFIEAVHKRTGSISIMPISCNRLRVVYFSESSKSCLK